MKLYIVSGVTLLFGVVFCRDFYVGIFRRNDYLVAQDTLYKERVPYRLQFAKYGRLFKCPITYIRVVDRLGYGRGPRVKMIRGGLQKKYVVMRMSAYNSPISVNIYVGCENKVKPTKPPTKPTTSKPADDGKTESGTESNNATESSANEIGTTAAGDDADKNATTPSSGDASGGDASSSSDNPDAAGPPPDE